MTTTVHVYDKDTQAPIEGATVTCTNYTPQLTDGSGNTSFDLGPSPFARYGLRANADGYVISEQQSIVAADNYVDFALEKEEQIQITVKRPTWVSMELFPVREDFPIGEELNVMGTIRVETEPYANKDIWLVDNDTNETISEHAWTSDTGYYTIPWTPHEYKVEGYNVTIGAHEFYDWENNPNSKWSEMPNGRSLHINVIGAGFEETIRPTTLEWSTPDTYHAAFDITNLNPAYTYAIVIGRKGGPYGRTVSSKSVSNVTATSIEADIGKSELDTDGYQIWCSIFKTSPGAQTQEAHELYTVPQIEHAALSVTTHQPFFGISETGAENIKGSVANTNGLQTDIGFEYGETTSYGNTTWAGETTIPCDFYKDLVGLKPGTTYHIRAIATNEIESAHGVDKTFKTVGVGGFLFNISLPETDLLETSEVMACDDYTLACTRFNFKITNNYYTGLTAWYTVSIADGGTLYSGTVSVPGYGSTETISDHICALPGPGSLQVGTHTIKVEVGQVDQGVDVSVSEVLTVLEYGTPTVYTQGVENPTLNSARLVGTLKDVDIETTVGFEYGLRYGNTTTEWLVSPIKGGTFKLNITNLEGNETYRFRAVGRIEDKMGFGEEKLFETVPAVITPISMGWNLEDAKMGEYNAHLRVSNLSEAKRYRVLLYGGRGYEFARIDPVAGLKEAEIKANIPLERFEEYGYEIHCGVYDLDTSEWLLTEGYPVSPLNVSVNMGETIAAGGIPEEMETRTDTTFTFIVNNNSTTDLNLDVFLSFKGVDSAQEYSRDLVGLQPSEGVYILPGSDITVLNDGYIAKEMLILKAGESGSYTLKVWLPDEAVPSEGTYAEYTIHTKVGVYTG